MPRHTFGKELKNKVTANPFIEIALKIYGKSTKGFQTGKNPQESIMHGESKDSIQFLQNSNNYGNWRRKNKCSRYILLKLQIYYPSAAKVLSILPG